MRATRETRKTRAVIALATLLCIVHCLVLVGTSKTSLDLDANTFCRPAVTLSLLACVTGSWSSAKGRTEERLLYLDVILRNYVQLCESGYDVSVVLILYSHGRDFPRYVSPEKYRCERTKKAIRITFDFFPLRPIPATTISGKNTDGDLAIRHREVFARERKKYDLFIVQEDDVSVDAGSLRLYKRSYCTFRQSETYFPALFDSEIKNGTKYVSWRLRAGTFRKFLGNTTFEISHEEWGGRSYILTSHDLDTFVTNYSAWIDPLQIQGRDFNPAVASTAWLHDLKRLALLVDTEDWRGAGIHHLSNKYSKRDVPNTMFDMPMEDEVADIFRSCVQDDVEKISDVTISGDSCKACLDGHRTALLTSTIEYETRRKMHAEFSCV